MEIIKCKNKAELDLQAAEMIADLVRSKPNTVLGLATGGTPVGVYERLVEQYREGKLSFRRVTTFNLDEYIGLPEGHPESYRAYMKRHLFDQVNIPPSQTHIPDGSASDPWAECTRYDRLLEQYPVDLQILGIGHNGHIGFNEPGEGLKNHTHVVKLSESTRQANSRYFQSMSEVPGQAITMGVGTILKAKKIMLLANGSDKSAIVRRALTGDITTLIPASLLQTHPNLSVMLDHEAGREIECQHTLI